MRLTNRMPTSSSGGSNFPHWSMFVNVFSFFHYLLLLLLLSVLFPFIRHRRKVFPGRPIRVKVISVCSIATALLTCRHNMLLILALCVIRPAAATSSDVHTTHSESDFGNNDARPVDVDEYGVRNYVSDHELPRDVPTRVEIVGDLGTPPPSVRIDFVPKQTYVQVRRYDAVKRLPQEAAMKEASTSEEVANASRLREVVTHKKTQEVIFKR